MVEAERSHLNECRSMGMMPMSWCRGSARVVYRAANPMLTLSFMCLPKGLARSGVRKKMHLCTTLGHHDLGLCVKF